MLFDNSGMKSQGLKYRTTLRLEVATVPAPASSCVNRARRVVARRSFGGFDHVVLHLGHAVIDEALSLALALHRPSGATLQLRLASGELLL